MIIIIIFIIIFNKLNLTMKEKNDSKDDSNEDSLSKKKF